MTTSFERHEPSRHADELAHAVIGAAIEVHRHLGPGYLESIYERALLIELGHRSIPFESQPTIPIDYRGIRIGEPQLDLIVGGELVVELKAVDRLSELHYAQVLSYLKAGAFELALLINFNARLLKDGIKRIVRTT